MKRYAKSIAAACGAIAAILGTLTLSGTAAHVVAGAIPVLTWLSVFLVPNEADAVPEPPAPEPPVPPVVANNA